MDKKNRKVVYSETYAINLETIFNYGVTFFGRSAVVAFLENLYHKTQNLTNTSEIYPECRYLKTNMNMAQFTSKF